MKRLTCKIDGKYALNPHVSPDLFFTKLGQIEDSEEQLGIDSVLALKALTNGIYTDDGEFIDGCQLRLTKFRIRLPNGVDLPFTGPVGYGKSWAMTKEELK